MAHIKKHSKRRDTSKKALLRNHSSAGKSKKGKKLTKAEQKQELNLQSLQELIDRGRTRGFVTDGEVLTYFPHIEEDVAFLERVYDELEKVNI